MVCSGKREENTMTIEELYELVPEFMLVQDEILREKCAAVWLEAIQLGGWEEKGLENLPMAANLNRQDMPSKGFVHLRMTARAGAVMTKRCIPWIQKYRDCTADYVVAGALLHDVGKFMELDLTALGMPIYNPQYGQFKHTQSGAYLCKKHGIPDEIVQGVANHSTMQTSLTGKTMCPESALIKGTDLFAVRYFSTGGPDIGRDMILV